MRPCMWQWQEGTQENPDYDWADRASARINVEREWNAAKKQNRNALFYLLNIDVSRKVQVLSSAPFH